MKTPTPKRKLSKSLAFFSLDAAKLFRDSKNGARIVRRMKDGKHVVRWKE